MQPRPFDAIGIEIARAGNFALFQALARKLPGVKHIDKIAGDIMTVIREYTNLYAHTTTFFNAHGIEELRVCVKGLVSTTFKGGVYQTPITIWVSSRYPDEPPEFYVDVSAATGMIVAPGHPCVAKDGQVRPATSVSSPPRFCSDCSYSPPGCPSSHADVGVVDRTRPHVTNISAAKPAIILLLISPFLTLVPRHQSFRPHDDRNIQPAPAPPLQHDVFYAQCAPDSTPNPWTSRQQLPSFAPRASSPHYAAPPRSSLDDALGHHAQHERAGATRERAGDTRALSGVCVSTSCLGAET